MKVFKNKKAVDIVCVRHCPYYKGKKDELYCGGLEFFLKLIDKKSLSLDILDIEKGTVNHRFDRLLNRLICSRCEFIEKDCDYRGSNPNASPCGGYILLSLLIEKKLLGEKDLGRLHS